MGAVGFAVAGCGTASQSIEAVLPSAVADEGLLVQCVGQGLGVRLDEHGRAPRTNAEGEETA